jgi:hypothetical protein
MSEFDEVRRNVLISGAAVAAGIGLPWRQRPLNPSKELNK